jgi:hypothetical protein
MKVRVCECCGHPVPPAGVEATLPPVQRRMFRAVQRSGAAGIATADLMDAVYGDDPDGGPTWRTVLPTTKSHMAPRLAAFGLRIHATRGHGSRWTLRPL